MKLKGRELKAFLAMPVLLFISFNCLQGQGKWSATTFKDSLAFEYDWVQDHASTRHCFPGVKNCRAIDVPEKRADNSCLSYNEIANYFGFDVSRVYGQSIMMSTPLELTFDKVRLEMDFFAHNVSEILLVVYGERDQWVARSFPITHDGFQPAQQAYLVTFDQNDPRKFQQGKFHITGIGIYFLKAKPELSSALKVGALKLQEFYAYRPGMLAPWLTPMFPEKKETGYYLMDSYATWYYEQLGSLNRQFTYLPSFDEFSVQQGLISRITQFSAKKVDEGLMLYEFLRLAIKNYPYNEEKGIDTRKVHQDLADIFKLKGSTDEALFTALSKFIDSKFTDPHFKLILPSQFSSTLPRKTFGPVRIKEIGGFLKVVANFDAEYSEQIPVGSIVKSINDVPASKFLSGAKNLEEELYKQAHESVILTFVDPLNSALEGKIQVLYNRKMNIPRNFQAKHGEFKLIENSIAYLRIRTWSGENIYNLLNHRTEILKTGKLIIDLRGNGGGNDLEVYQILSLFFDTINSIGERQHTFFRESIAIIPNHEELRIPSSVRVTILIDSETACASEIFLVGIKKRPGAMIVGDSETMGAIASPNFFRFPSGVQVEYHGAFRKFVFDPAVFREGRGISPDILVSRTSPQDLYPYQDKVCKVASSLLNR